MSILTALRSRMRNVLVAGGSLAVIAAIALFVAAPTSSALELDARQAGATPAGKVVVYGSVEDAAGKPISGAKVSLTHKVGKKTKTVLTATSTKAGTYRGTAKVANGTYTFKISARSGKKTYSASTKLRVRSGRAYEVSGSIKKSAIFNILPISTY